MHQRGWRARVAVAGCALLLAAVAGPGASASGSASDPTGRSASDPNDWRAIINLYRAQAGVAPLAEVASWSQGARDHARYVVENDAIGHTQNPLLPFATDAGAAAAANGNVAGWFSSPVTAQEAVELWLGGPFHGVGLLDPDLRQTGFGLRTDGASPGVESAAVMDVLRGVQSGANTTYPRLWPGNGASIPLTTLAPEAPEPLTSCPGYARPAGQPLYAFFASAPTVTSVVLRNAISGLTLERCVITETTYANPDPDLRDIGRSVLALRHAVVVIPRQPLVEGQRYEIAVTANAQSKTSSFTVGPLAWGPFFDVAPDHQFVADITWMVEQGIAAGYSDGTFRPTAAVTRQAMVSFLWKLFGAPTPVDGDPGFSDVPIGHPFRTAIAWAVEEGIVSGYADGTFRPTVQVTRQAAMAFLWRSIGSPPPLDPDPGFSDVSSTNPLRPAIAWAVEWGIAAGFADGGFHPGAVVSRQAAAAFLHRMPAIS